MASQAFRSSSTWGSPILTVEDGKVYEGSSTWGAPILTIESGGRMTAAAAAVFLLLM